jgi:hypothetical protein
MPMVSWRHARRSTLACRVGSRRRQNRTASVFIRRPASLAESNQSFARGFNDEILAALGSGGIDVDFRPLLMSRDEIERELDRNLLGTLSVDNLRIDSPNGDFSLSLRRPKPNPRAKRAKAVTSICYEHESGGRWPSLYTYQGPWRVALGRNGRVLIFETECLYLTQDVATTQVLNRYRHAQT